MLPLKEAERDFIVTTCLKKSGESTRDKKEMIYKNNNFLMEERKSINQLTPALRRQKLPDLSSRPWST